MRFFYVIGCSVVLMLSLSVSYAFGQADKSQQEARQLEDGLSNELRPEGFSVPIVIRESPSQRVEREIEKDETKLREVADLAAQESMARSTTWVVWFTALQVVIASLGTLALVYTIYLNRKATDAALISAKAANDAVAMERAWLTPGPTNCGPFVNGRLRDRVTLEDQYIEQGLIFMPAFVNTGRSPATNASVSMQHAIIDQDDELPIFEFNEETAINGAVVPANAGLSGQIILNDEEAASISGMGRRLIICAKASYNTVFEQQTIDRKISVFCIEAVHMGGTIGQGDASRLAINFYPVGLQNYTR